jgi:[ribosomal protein S18]-alanine N-acetyltransferase
VGSLLHPRGMLVSNVRRASCENLASLSSARRPTYQYLLEVKETNAAAVHLYQKLGFEVCGRRRNYYQDGTDAKLLILCQNQ